MSEWLCELSGVVVVVGDVGGGGDRAEWLGEWLSE